jgi:hypothetical protein
MYSYKKNKKKMLANKILQIWHTSVGRCLDLKSKTTNNWVTDSWYMLAYILNIIPIQNKKMDKIIIKMLKLSS